MKLNKFCIKTFLLFYLICGSIFIEANQKISLILGAKKLEERNKFNIKSSTTNTKLTKHANILNSNTKITNSKRKTNKFSRIMKNKTKYEILKFLKELFKNIKDKITSLIDNKSKTTKETVELKVLTIIWDQIINYVVKVDQLVSRISFIANNPMTALLLKIKEMTFDKLVEYQKPKEKEKDPEEEEEKKLLELQMNYKLVSEKKKIWIVRGKDYLLNKMKHMTKELATVGLKNYVTSKIENIYVGFFRAMLVEFSPITMINNQDSQNLSKLESYIINETSGQTRSAEDAVTAHSLTKDVLKFIDATVNTCKDNANIKKTTIELIDKIVYTLSINFSTIRDFIEKFNNITREEGIDPTKREVAFKKLVEDNIKDNTPIVEKIVEMAKLIWEVVYTELKIFLVSVKECFSTYNENFVKFIPNLIGGVVASTVGGILDGFVKSIPVVSQVIGLVNWAIGIYNAWRVYSFGVRVASSLANPQELDTDNIGVKLAKFLCSKVRALLGLTSIPAIENVLKIGYGIFLIGMNFVSKNKNKKEPKIEEDKDKDKDLLLKELENQQAKGFNFTMQMEDLNYDDIDLFNITMSTVPSVQERKFIPKDIETPKLKISAIPTTQNTKSFPKDNTDANKAIKPSIPVIPTTQTKKVFPSSVSVNKKQLGNVDLIDEEIKDANITKIPFSNNQKFIRPRV